MTHPHDRGKEERFVALYREHRPKVLAYVRRRLPEADALDAASDTFMTAWRHFEQAPDDPLPWLYGMARHAVLNHRRGTKRWLRLKRRAWSQHVPEAAPDPAALKEASNAVRTGWLALSEDDREVLRLAAWEGLAGEQLAVALGCSPQAARVRLHRARRRLEVLLPDVQPCPAPPQASPDASTAPVH